MNAVALITLFRFFNPVITQNHMIEQIVILPAISPIMPVSLDDLNVKIMWMSVTIHVGE